MFGIGEEKIVRGNRVNRANDPRRDGALIIAEKLLSQLKSHFGAIQEYSNL